MYRQTPFPPPSLCKVLATWIKCTELYCTNLIRGVITNTKQTKIENVNVLTKNIVTLVHVYTRITYSLWKVIKACAF